MALSGHPSDDIETRLSATEARRLPSPLPLASGCVVPARGDAGVARLAGHLHPLPDEPDPLPLRLAEPLPGGGGSGGGGGDVGVGGEAAGDLAHALAVGGVGGGLAVEGLVGVGAAVLELDEYLRMYLKEDLPSRLHYADSYRIPPIIGLPEEGYKVEMKRSDKNECGGAHGYDNAFFSMRTIFIAHGPRFEGGRVVPSFENVEIYNVIASILNLEPAPNNGSSSFPDTILLPSE